MLTEILLFLKFFAAGIRLGGSRHLVSPSGLFNVPPATQIVAEAKYLVEELEGVSEVNIEIVWDPLGIREK